MKSVFNSFSYFLFIFVSWYSLLSHCVVVVFSLNSEGEALFSLLNGFSSASVPDSIKLSWNNLSDSSRTPCHWSGVTCNTKNHHVVSLNLSYYWISGQLGHEIGQLRYLETIDLRGNLFNGSIPAELWNCSHLQHLELTGNSFTGELPEAVNNLHQLKSLGLSSNNFNGPIPTKLWNCTHLQHLDLSFNKFIAELPEAVRNLWQLTFFEISGNHLSGRIPESLFQISGLESIYLLNNNLTGSIPLNIGNATNMNLLSLSGNQLHGIIPISIANCTKLAELRLQDNNLGGEIPLRLWRIPTLAYIDVSNNNLLGELPVEMTTGLHHLKEIHLHSNQFSGLIPEALGINSTSLELVDFSNNTFSGKIPPNLCFGKTLDTMKLYLNHFHGSIPPSYIGNCYSLRKILLRGNNLTLLDINKPQFKISSSLRLLDISRNNVHGNFPLWICNLSFLGRLDLSENNMSGPLPHCLGDLNQLFNLNLRNNDFSGTVHLNFTSNELLMLDLNGNCFEGKIPRSLIHSPRLAYLDLGNNQLNDTFPFFLEKASDLVILALRSNKLYGPLKRPSTRLAFDKLKILDISNNYFTGNLPLEFIMGLSTMKHVDPPIDYVNADIFYLRISIVVIHKGKEVGLNSTFMDTFRAIDMSNNALQGTIPKSIGELLSLTMLNLSNNNLSGRIPSSLGNLIQLESLDLSKNKLSGEIPWQLTNLNFLAALNLSHNNLTGRIPNGRQFQTFSNNSFDGNPGLCGSQSSSGCGDDAGKGSRRDPIEEKESYEDSKFWDFSWEPVVTGYWCGIIIGLVIQYFVFTKALLYRWFG